VPDEGFWDIGLFSGILLVLIHVFLDEVLESAEFAELYVKTCTFEIRLARYVGINTFDNIWLPENVQGIVFLSQTPECQWEAFSGCTISQSAYVRQH